MKRSPLHLTVVLPLGIMCLTGWGCDEIGPDHGKTKIYGGYKTEPGSWPSALALVSKGHSFCSAVAVSPTLILTAAHCVNHRPWDEISIYHGDGHDEEELIGQNAVQTIVKSPRYTLSSYDESYDIAYIIPKTPLELPEPAYIRILSDPSELKELVAVNKNTRLVGFGTRNGNVAGSKWEVDARITRFNSSEVHIGGAGKDSCDGDSGGPVFGRLSTGEWRLIGTTVGGGDCGEGGRYALTLASACWLETDSGVNLSLAPDTCDSTSN